MAVFQEIKQEGVKGFDKYRNFTLSQGDVTEKLVAKYKQLQTTITLSPAQTKGGTFSVTQNVSKAINIRTAQ